MNDIIQKMDETYLPKIKFLLGCKADLTSPADRHTYSDCKNNNSDEVKKVIEVVKSSHK